MSNNRRVKKILATYERQIRKDMGFWIKYRPSRWGRILPRKPFRLLIKFFKTRGGKTFVFILALIFSLLFVGVIPTVNFIWSNIFRLWLLFLFIPLFYWSFAITSVYARVLGKVFYKFIRVLFSKLTE